MTGCALWVMLKGKVDGGLSPSTPSNKLCLFFDMQDMVDLKLGSTEWTSAMSGTFCYLFYFICGVTVHVRRLFLVLSTSTFCPLQECHPYRKINQICGICESSLDGNHTLAIYQS